MIRILNQNLEVEANLKSKSKSKVLMANIKEEINREYSLEFEVIVDSEKSQYVNTNHIIEAENDYFDIVYTRKRQDSNGKFIRGQAEHVSYRLNDPEYDLEFFTEDNTPENILAKILEGTDFTVGTVEFTDQEVFSIQEESSRRSILVQFAEYLGGELQFNKFEISIVEARGQDNGVKFKVGKNIVGVEEEVDKRDGQLQVAYDVDVVDLSEYPRYQELGYADLEKVELGDTVRVIAPEIDIDEPQRVVSRTKDLVERQNLNVQIANFFDDLADDIYRIQRETVIKENIYNGIRIGPQNGFEAIRSDKKARTVMNATEGIKIQKGDGEGQYTDKFYADTEGNLNLEGNIVMNGGSISWKDVNSDPSIQEGVDEAKSVAESIADGTYTGGTFLDGTTIYAPLVSGGTVQAGDFVGGTIDIGNGEFEVLNDGSMYSTNAYIEGDIESSNIYGSYIEGAEIVGGTITSNTSIDVNTNLFVGDYIYVGDQSDYTNKGLVFATGTQESHIELLSSGDMDIFNWSDIIIDSDNLELRSFDNMFLDAGGLVDIFASDITLAGDTILDWNTWLGDNSSNDNLVATIGDIPDTTSFTKPYYSSNYCYVDANASGITIRDRDGIALGNIWYD